MTRTEAARTNGAKSQGPVTEQGKARSSRNAQSHGLCSEIVVMEGESQEAFDALAAAIFASHVPATIEEADLVFEIAANRWRLRRCMEMEKALFEEAKDRLRTDKENPITDERIVHRKALAGVTDSSAMKQLHRYNSRLRRAAEKAEQEFQSLRRDRIELAVELELSKQELEVEAELNRQELELARQEEDGAQPPAPPRQISQKLRQPLPSTRTRRRTNRSRNRGHSSGKFASESNPGQPESESRVSGTRSVTKRTSRRRRPLPKPLENLACLIDIRAEYLPEEER